MDGDQAALGFKAGGLAAIPGALQAVVDAGDVAGFVTLVWRRGELAQVDAVGWRDVESRLPMTRDTLFRIASMTKPITSVAALMLMEEGKLSLSDPITRWMPEFADMRVLKDPAGSLDDTYPAPRLITVEDVMTHRSGIAYGFTSVGPIAKAHLDDLGHPLASPHGPDDWLKRLAALPLSFPPGERFHYSHSTEVFGFLVARIEGKPLAEVLQDRIFGPLGMTDTAFWVPPEKRDRMAKLYRMVASGGLEDVSMPHLDRSPDYAAGGGGLVSTADDYLKFARMMLNRGELDGVKLLQPETIDLMTANRLTDAQRQVPFMGIPFWAGQGFGLGVSVVVDPARHAWMGSGAKGAYGWPGAFETWWQADPERDLIMIYLIQNSMELSPETAAQLATGQRMGGRAALPTFQKMVEAALD